MRATTAILALAGSALAAPWNKPGYKEIQNVHVVYETVVHTVYHTEGAPQPAKPTVYQPVTTVYEESTPTPAAPTSTKVAEYTPVPVSSAAPSATASAAPASGYQATVNTWRAKMGLSALANDAKLESNALDTVVSSKGEMVHKLNPGSFGQVLAPGEPEEFERVFVGGWLCEIPTLPGLDGVCETQSQGWAYNGQTGHAEILTSDNYSKIGCAWSEGIWCCDVA